MKKAKLPLGETKIDPAPKMAVCPSIEVDRIGARPRGPRNATYGILHAKSVRGHGLCDSMRGRVRFQWGLDELKERLTEMSITAEHAIDLGIEAYVGREPPTRRKWA